MHLANICVMEEISISMLRGENVDEGVLNAASILWNQNGISVTVRANIFISIYNLDPKKPLLTRLGFMGFVLFF